MSNEKLHFNLKLGLRRTKNISPKLYPNLLMPDQEEKFQQNKEDPKDKAVESLLNYEYEEDIEVIDNAVEKIKQLKGITYTLKSDGNRLTGLVAQDLEKVLPEAVYTEKDIETKDEHLAIRYGNTVGLLVEAIKELEARVKELEAK